MALFKKEYHTSISIDATKSRVWEELVNVESYPEWNPIVGSIKGELAEGAVIATFIKPLNKTFYPKVVVFHPEEELVWIGKQVAHFLMAGKHYYRLEDQSGKTMLYHGEYFTGLFAAFIPSKLLSKMKQAFIHHNQQLKQRIENER